MVSVLVSVATTEKQTEYGNANEVASDDQVIQSGQHRVSESQKRLESRESKHMIDINFWSPYGAILDSDRVF